MARKDIIMASQKDLKRLHVIHKAIEKVITQAEAARIAGLSERQIRRIVERIRQEEHIDGTMQITNNGKRVKFRSIQQRPEMKQKEQKKKRRRPIHVPSQDHPWRKTYRKAAAKKTILLWRQ
jgi:DNA-binding Lrp family transcriptional regulator